MTSRRQFTAWTTGSWLAGRLGAQPDPIEVLYENRSRLDGAVTPDRSEYFAGEGLRFTIRVRNPTNRDLLVPIPLHPDTGYVTMARQLPGGLVEPLGFRDDYGFPRPLPPTATFAAGSEIVRTFLPHEEPGPGILDHPISVPAEPGRYVLSYVYAGDGADFRVIVPTLEKLAEVKLRRQRVLEPDPDDAVPKRVFRDLYRAAFAVRHDNASHLCVCYRDDSTPFSATHLLGRALDDLGANQLSPYRRIASNPAATASIAIRETALDDLEIIWTDVNNAQRVFVVKHTTLDPV